MKIEEFLKLSDVEKARVCILILQGQMKIEREKVHQFKKVEVI